MRVTLVAAIAATTFLLGAAAQATTGWRVIGTGTETGKYGEYAGTNVNVVGAKELAVRASLASKVTWFFSCSGEAKIAANGVAVASTASAKKCNLSGSAVTNTPGTLRVELLKR